jgi:hypothetical protein
MFQTAAKKARGRRVALASAVVGALAAGLVGGPGAAGAEVAAERDGYGKVSVVHAVPGLKVDVYANGRLLLEDFRPGQTAGPLRVPADTYRLKVTRPNKSKAVLARRATLERGADASIVAYLGQSGTPKLGVFANNIGPVRSGRARLTVRHVAAAPKVDVALRRHGEESRVVVSGLANGGEATGKLEAGRTGATVFVAGTKTRAIGPAPLRLRSQKHVFVYAWGSADSGYRFLVQSRGAAKS